MKFDLGWAGLGLIDYGLWGRLEGSRQERTQLTRECRVGLDQPVHVGDRSRDVIVSMTVSKT